MFYFYRFEFLIHILFSISKIPQLVFFDLPIMHSIIVFLVIYFISYLANILFIIMSLWLCLICTVLPKSMTQHQLNFSWVIRPLIWPTLVKPLLILLKWSLISILHYNFLLTFISVIDCLYLIIRSLLLAFYCLVIVLHIV